MALADAIQHHALRLHQVLYERSGGALGHRMIGVPTLLLRSTGRRSGKERCNALVYAQDGADYVLVASNGDSDRPPGWLFNIQSNPEVEVQIGRVRRNPDLRVSCTGETPNTNTSGSSSTTTTMDVTTLTRSTRRGRFLSLW